jgi:tRNA G18 (ribose-2'-O)-methylase SpoU
MSGPESSSSAGPERNLSWRVGASDTADSPTRHEGTRVQPAGSSTGPPSPIAIDDPGDPRLVDYARLVDVGHRVRREPADGLFIAEGGLTLRRALDAGYTPRSVLLTPNRLDPAAEEIAAVQAAGGVVYVVGPDIAERLTGFQVHRGLLAAMNRRALPPIGDVLRAARRVLVLEDIVNHTNVGAAIRGGAAFGADAVLVTPACADPLYRRAVRTSMGTVFQVPWTRLTNWPGDLNRLHDAGFVSVALTPEETAQDIAEFAAAGYPRIALVLGTEGEGLAATTLAATTHRVRIPMAPGVDSLNVAAAAAVACYALR